MFDVRKLFEMTRSRQNGLFTMCLLLYSESFKLMSTLPDRPV